MVLKLSRCPPYILSPAKIVFIVFKDRNRGRKSQMAGKLDIYKLLNS
jgi:hypothetical protein